MITLDNVKQLFEKNDFKTNVRIHKDNIKMWYTLDVIYDNEIKSVFVFDYESKGIVNL